MMESRDLLSYPKMRHIALRQKLGTDSGMSVDEMAFRVLEFLRIQQDPVRDTYLSNVVEAGGKIDSKASVGTPVKFLGHEAGPFTHTISVLT